MLLRDYCFMHNITSFGVDNSRGELLRQSNISGCTENPTLVGQ
jgi:hypothetical protein